ncbi:cell envelope-related transcriptional attenuator [Paucilactobacillus vaccinostercus DSM 20634]|uniref:Cell envelope-related transcriptional attenuator n=1 Tax=Paucilactobacillus vaccinostercus DSM 20634 TaxID=1423813 RepID=A0A0R2A307_9LACO|nr:LCP family protein [Paucilactobacillus vaccinostercus]KRM61373.1 cell envelope-related transcriptional attenuator [Paucilactobacillus vaccinostercus DSM 20634]RRG10380.1 MAG: transcriptional regulator [Lactobacillus sp.]
MDQEETRVNRRRNTHNHKQQKPQKHQHHWIRWVVGVVAILLLAAVGYEYHKVHSTATGIFSNSSSKVSKKLQEGKPVSVLLMGLDTGALGRANTGGNTDTLEVVTVNPKKETITMTSVPRDTLVKVKTSKGADYVKINAAYAIGGPKQTVKQVKELLNIPIDYYAIVNMGVLKKVVNAVGGVTVDNPFAFTYEGHHFPKGKQKLNGNNALKYSRMRYDDPNNDYGRQKRQQQVIKSVIKELKGLGSVSAVNKILDAAKQGVRTNIPINSLATLYANYHKSMKHVKTYHFQGLNATISGTSFQIASPKEINRVSKLIRHALGLKYTKVTNNETAMYDGQSNYDGITNVDFILPNNAEYNVAGSGSSSSSKSSSTKSTSTTYGTHSGTTGSTTGTTASKSTGTGTTGTTTYGNYTTRHVSGTGTTTGATSTSGNTGTGTATTTTGGTTTATGTGTTTGTTAGATSN